VDEASCPSCSSGRRRRRRLRFRREEAIENSPSRPGVLATVTYLSKPSLDVRVPTFYA
jgi:hypothetical protein